MASFWDKAGGAAKWITDPKQLLTAAGFVLGGPVGAGAGRAVGGMVPQSAGPVPWGALGANTDEFRESTLADGLQWEDVGQAGKDFASGYSAGQVGQQIPGLRDLEGAFAGGAEAGQSMGVDALMKDNPDFMPTPDLGSGVSSVGAPPSGVAAAPMAQRSAGSGVGDSVFPSFDYFGGGGGDLTMRGQPVVSYAEPMTQAFGGQPSMGAEAMGMNNPGLMSAPSFAPSPQTPAQTALERAQTADEVQKGGGFFSGMNGLEKMYAINMAANLGSSMFAGPQSIGAGGMEMLGQQGLFSRAPQRQIGSFDDWISKRGTYAG